MTDHDQRFKHLLKEFFGDFFRMFFPDWADRFDFEHVEWLDKEVFTDPPQGERRYLDLVARVPVRRAIVGSQSDPTERWIVLVHVEIESEDKVAPFRPRMFSYYEQLRRQHRLPVLPIGLYLRVGLKGVGWEVYEEFFWEQRLLHFEYAYIGLPALDAEKHVAGPHLLGVALAALMRVPEAQKAELKVEALRRVTESGENDKRRFMLAECVQAYWTLQPPQLQEFQELLVTEKYKDTHQMMTTMFEQGIQQGRADGQRELLRVYLENRFAPLSDQVRGRLASWPAGQLTDLFQAALEASSLKELGLED